jgi:hypothetical protein
MRIALRYVLPNLVHQPFRLAGGDVRVHVEHQVPGIQAGSSDPCAPTQGFEEVPQATGAVGRTGQELWQVEGQGVHILLY